MRMIKKIINKFFVISNFLGGNMHRLLRLSFLFVLLGVLAFTEAGAIINKVFVSGRVAPDDVRVFVKDSVYVIERDYVIGGTLIIEPGTTILFEQNGRLIDSVGGRIIADGYAKAEYEKNPLIPAAWNPFSFFDEKLYPDYPGDPMYNPKNNPFDYEDYADLDYFLYNTSYLINDNTYERVIKNKTVRDATVNSAKYHHIFHVVLDRSIDPATGRERRQLKNLNNPNDVVWDATDMLYYLDDGTGNPDKRFVVIPFENALMFTTARLSKDPEDDIDLRSYPWTRVETPQGLKPTVDIGTGTKDLDMIKFYGQPVNSVSKEWGHILILPGSRAAFFRNCTFEHFKKDTTVDRTPLYDEMLADGINWSFINNKMRLLTNGSGGAITTLSSRTWLLDCSFKDNTARHKGGALAILQTPCLFEAPDGYGFPKDEDPITGDLYDIYNYNLIGRYPLDKNPAITNKDGSLSDINKFKVDIFTDPILGDQVLLDPVTGYPVPAAEGDNTYMWLSAIPAIDLIDEDDPEPTFNFDGNTDKADYYRQAFDDGRLAVYLGRMRNLSFERNKVQLANVGERVIPGNPPVVRVEDLIDEPADYPREYGNHAFGGAIYISGDKYDPMTREIEIAFGLNNIINLNDGTSLTFTQDDSFACIENEAKNYQNQLPSSTIKGTKGARGGAIYLGSNTSLIVAGDFTANIADAEFLLNDMTSADMGYYDVCRLEAVPTEIIARIIPHNL